MDRGNMKSRTGRHVPTGPQPICDRLRKKPADRQENHTGSLPMQLAAQRPARSDAGGLPRKRARGIRQPRGKARRGGAESAPARVARRGARENQATCCSVPLHPDCPNQQPRRHSTDSTSTTRRRARSDAEEQEQHHTRCVGRERRHAAAGLPSPSASRLCPVRGRCKSARRCAIALRPREHSCLVTPTTSTDRRGNHTLRASLSLFS